MSLLAKEKSYEVRPHYLCGASPSLSKSGKRRIRLGNAVRTLPGSAFSQAPPASYFLWILAEKGIVSASPGHILAIS